MRATHIGLLVVLALGLGCRSSSSVPEPGAVLLQVGCADGVSAPDELRVWAYHETGVLWDGTRIPEHGALDSTNPAKLGTILIAPGTIQGALRIHVRAYAVGQRLADGFIAIASLSGEDRTHELHLQPALPDDSDGDDVPDAIDDCPGVPNPAQGGCAAAPAFDAGMTDGARPADAVAVDTRNLAADSSTAGDIRDVSPSSEDARPSLDKGVTVMTDVAGKADAWDAPVNLGDAPDSSASVKIDVGPTIPDGRRVDADSSVPFDLAFDQTALPDVHAPVDLVIPADAATTDGDSSPLDGDRADTHEEDVGGTNSRKSQGEPCEQNEECASTFCADGVCCTNACVGPCRSCNQPDDTGSCHGYTAGTDPEYECLEGAKCNGVGACGTVPGQDKANGQLCGSGAECTSGICKDNVCCNTACNLPCQTCGSGTCEPVKSARDTPECSDGKTCNGAGKCVSG